MDLSRLRTTRTVANLRAGRNDWFRIKAQADGPTQVMIYDEIGWFGVTAQDFINEMKQVNGPIDLHLNSPGGEVWDGIAIHSFLANRGGVTTYVDSLAASIASVIAMAGEEIVMGRNASLMIHDGWGLVIGNAADMREQAELLDRVSDNIAAIYADRTGKPKGDWRTAMLAETWYIGQEAVDAGLADRMADPPAKRSKAAQDDEATKLAAYFDLSVFRNTPDRLKSMYASSSARNHAAEHSELEARQALAQARTDAEEQLKLLSDSESSAGNKPEGGAESGPAVSGQVDQPASESPPTFTQPHNEAPADTDRGFSIPAGGPMDSIPAEPFRDWLNQGLALIGDQGSASGSDSISNAAMHEPYDGTHTHAHPAFGAQGDDYSHEHEHTHSGDADHRHDHGDEESDADGGMTTNSLTGSRILGIESMPLENKALPVHHTGTVDEPWDGPAAVKAMPNDASVLAYCHAWEDSAADDGTADDPDGDADDKKSSWKFPHHLKKGGPANLAACRNGLARLPGSKIPDSDKAGVEKHLQAHLDDANKSDSGNDGDAPSNHTHDDIDFAWDPSMTAALKEAMQ